MRHATGELANAFHLLRLVQRCFGVLQRQRGLMVGRDVTPYPVHQPAFRHRRPQQQAITAVPTAVAVFKTIGGDAASQLVHF